MNTKTRWKVGGLALALGLAWALPKAASAATTDSLTVTVTPNAAYSVTITTTNVVLNLGTVSLSASTQTVKPSTVTVNSSYAATGLKLQGTMGGTGTPWTFAINSAAQTTDQLAAWAVFTDTSVTSYTTLGATGTGSNYFTGTSSGIANTTLVGTGNTGVGNGAASSLPEFIAAAGQTGFKTMASIPSSAVDAAASKAHMWMYFVLPPATTDNNAKLVTFTLTAGAPN